MALTRDACIGRHVATGRRFECGAPHVLPSHGLVRRRLDRRPAGCRCGRRQLRRGVRVPPPPPADPVGGAEAARGDAPGHPVSPTRCQLLQDVPEPGHLGAARAVLNTLRGGLALRRRVGPDCETSARHGGLGFMLLLARLPNGDTALRPLAAAGAMTLTFYSGAPDRAGQGRVADHPAVLYSRCRLRARIRHVPLADAGVARWSGWSARSRRRPAGGGRQARRR